MQQIKDIVKGPYEPQDNTVMWIDTSNPDAPIAKVHSNGEWRQQIAQQDYLKIVGKTIEDAELYVGLVKAIQAGTIFDVVLQYLNMDGLPEEDRIISHIVDIDRTTNTLICFDSFHGTLQRIEIYYSKENYEALAAVQRGGFGYGSIPAITSNDEVEPGVNVMMEDGTGGFVVCNGKCVVVEDDAEGKIVSAKTSDISAPSGEPVYEIEESDLPNFVGLMLA